MEASGAVRVGVDIGGTFTDFVVSEEGGHVLDTFKLPSTPEDPAEAVLRGLERIRASRTALREVVHGSTVATNAVLEREGARTAFVTTAGFRDTLVIGRQDRPSLYDFRARPTPPLVPPERCFEVDERVASDGSVLRPLERAGLQGLAAAVRDSGAESVAVSLLFSFLRPDHEQTVAARLREEGLFVSVSSEVLPEFREYERASTTVLDAYVTPVLDRYLERLERGMEGTRLRILHSNGGSARASEARRHGVRSLLSGPAGGVVAALHVARETGREGIITLDMGGTSTDVSLARGEPRLTSEAVVDGLPVRVPVVDIHTVGSGGGSIARLDPGGALRVGPASAGADPGPACYGRGGTEPTVTDANVVLGRLPPDRFLGGEVPLDEEASREAIGRLARDLGLEGEEGLWRAALGVIRVAEARVERALRVISVERGHDPADFTLVAYGGAGGLHAARLARSLGIGTVLVPRAASTLSALGMLVAPVSRDYVQTVMLGDDATAAELRERAAPLVRRGRDEVAAEGVPVDRLEVETELDVRYRGQSYELTVSLADDYRDRFHAEHERAYGWLDPDGALEVVNVRVRARGRVEPPQLEGEGRRGEEERGEPEGGRQGRAGEAAQAEPERRRVVCASPAAPPSPQSGNGRAWDREAGPADVPLHDGERLRAGLRIEGPAVIVRRDTTVFLDRGDRARADDTGGLVIRPAGARSGDADGGEGGADDGDGGDVDR